MNSKSLPKCSRTIVVTALLIGLLALLIGCGGGGGNPVTPPENPENHPPLAIASVENTEVELGQTVLFTNLSTDPDDAQDITSSEWDFSFDPVAGFNTESQENNPEYQFPEEGVFNVQLKVTDKSGASDMLDEPLVITVLPSVIPPGVPSVVITNCPSSVSHHEGQFAFEWELFDTPAPMSEMTVEVQRDAEPWLMLGYTESPGTHSSII